MAKKVVKKVEYWETLGFSSYEGFIRVCYLLVFNMGQELNLTSVHLGPKNFTNMSELSKNILADMIDKKQKELLMELTMLEGRG